jgi:hypothetical protein
LKREIQLMKVVLRQIRREKRKERTVSPKLKREILLRTLRLVKRKS